MSEKNFSSSRRRFLGRSVAATGLLVSGTGLAKADPPCPPSLHGAGVGAAPSACIGDVEQDWNMRIADPGVVWFHDFRSAAEVDAFRWAGGYGNDPSDVGTTRLRNTVLHSTNDGITGGGCLELHRFAGSREGGDWWRPWSPISASGNGKGVDDPGANGSIPVRVWDSGYRSQTEQWSGGNYGPSSTGNWDGNTFYLQMALKVDSRRRDAGFHGGKITYLTRTNKSLTAQELVTSYASSRNYTIYHAGSPTVPNSLPTVQHVFDEWATYLYKVVPGDENQPNTSIEVWRAIRGETNYTKIFEKLDHTAWFDGGFDKAWNALICSTYHNGANINTDFYQRYDQIIFSKNFIPCPQVWA